MPNFVCNARFSSRARRVVTETNEAHLMDDESFKALSYRASERDKKSCALFNCLNNGRRQTTGQLASERDKWTSMCVQFICIHTRPFPVEFEYMRVGRVAQLRSGDI